MLLKLHFLSRGVEIRSSVQLVGTGKRALHVLHSSSCTISRQPRENGWERNWHHSGCVRFRSHTILWEWGHYLRFSKRPQGFLLLQLRFPVRVIGDGFLVLFQSGIDNELLPIVSDIVLAEGVMCAGDGSGE
jgi:hypothetical protein